VDQVAFRAAVFSVSWSVKRLGLRSPGRSPLGSRSRGMIAGNMQG